MPGHYFLGNLAVAEQLSGPDVLFSVYCVTIIVMAPVSKVKKHMKRMRSKKKENRENTRVLLMMIIL